jgi:hypothetical protein
MLSGGFLATAFGTFGTFGALGFDRFGAFLCPLTSGVYRGLEKNTNRLYLLAGFTNLLRAEKYLPG